MKSKFKSMAKKFAGYLKGADKITALLAVAILSASIFSFSASADPGSTAVNTNIGGTDMTISRFSEIISAAFNSNVSQSITHDGATKFFMDSVDRAATNSSNSLEHNRLTFGIVGNVLGHPGVESGAEDSANFWTDGSDASSKMITLETIWSLHDGKLPDGSEVSGRADTDLESVMADSSIAQYIIFGSALNYMGVDEFRDATSANDGVRMIIGYAAYILFILAYSASSIMTTVVEILHKMNVFMWIWDGLSGASIEAMKIVLGVETLDEVPLLVEIRSAVNVMLGLRWVLLGLSCLFFVAGITIWKTRDMNSAAAVTTKGRRLFYRLIIMCIGIPICGMFYTEGLDIIGDFSESARHSVTSYVFQEFMDFEGWTTKLTYKSGMLNSFQVGAVTGTRITDDDGNEVGSSEHRPYAKFVVHYESDGNRFDISRAPSSGDLQPIDIAHFVYSVNEAVYGTDVTGSASMAAYANMVYSAATDDDGYGKGMTYEELIDTASDYVWVPEVRDEETGRLIESGHWASADASSGHDADAISASRDMAYRRCRDLLLNYARSITVSPDTLNSYYTNDMKRLSSLLVVAPSSSDPESSAANEAASMNATILEKLFGVSAAEQRIWQFVELEYPWIYSVDDSARNITLLDSKIQSTNTPVSIDLELKGLAIAPSFSDGTANGAFISSGGDGVPIMTETLSNMYTTTGTSGGSGDDEYTFTTGYSYTVGVEDGSVSVTNGSEQGTQANAKNYVYEYTYSLDNGGMSPLSIFNYLHSKFENGKLTVYSPKMTSNAGIGTMHYAVTTPYSGVPEIVQLAFILSVLFSLGIIGWVFGVSLLVNSIVQMCKALPIMLKMLMGSVQGFVEGMLIVFSVIIEMLVTIALYSLSVYIIDFLIRLIRGLATIILQVFGDGTNSIDPESYAIMSGLLSTAVILWGTFNLIKWRVAITISIKSMITNVLNSMFGTKAAMPTGASSGALKAAAGLAAGGMIAGALADQGTLDDVVNDLTQSDLGTSLHDKISEGDWDGAMQDIRDYAAGDYVSAEDGDGDIDRGANAEWDAQSKFGDGANGDDLGSAFGMQSLTDDQNAYLDDKYKDDAMEAAQRLEDARKNGDTEGAKKAQEDLNGILDARDAEAAEMRAENGRKARELGVADYGDYLRSQAADAEARGEKPIEGADIPSEPEKELTKDGAQKAYDAARDGDAATLREAAGVYDPNGLDEGQRQIINDMIADGATEAEIAAAIEDMAEENFGENHAAVVDKMNEAAGRTSGALYGSSDNSDGNARTVAVASGRDEEGHRTYGVKDTNSGEGAKTFTSGVDGLAEQFNDEVPYDPGKALVPPFDDVYDAALDGDTDALAAAAETLDENGLTEAQARRIDDMVANGASAEAVAAQVDKFATQNLGANHRAVMSRVNSAAGRSNTATYGDLVGDGPTMDVRAKGNELGGTDYGISANGGDESTFQTDGKGGATELPTVMSDAPSKALTSENQAIFEAARDGDTAMLRQMAGHVDANGLTHPQEQVIQDMIASGASSTEVAAAIDNFAQDNFGDDYKQVLDRMNAAAGRDSTVTYSTPTGGGPDGTQARALSVTSGYNDGQAAYAVNDLNDPDSGADMIQVSDSNGQSVYSNVTDGMEQVVTSDFGTSSGQTYGSIRNEVDAVANASGGLIARGGGAGGRGQTTVSEAAAAIASGQANVGVKNGARAQVGDVREGMFGGQSFSTNGVLNDYNAAARQAAENSGLQAGQVAGVAGGVDAKTGEVTYNLPTVQEIASAPVDLNGMPIVNGGAPGGGAQMIKADSVDSYGRGVAQSQNMLSSIQGGQPVNGGSVPVNGSAVPVGGGGQPTVPGGVTYGANTGFSQAPSGSIEVLPSGGVDAGSVPFASGQTPGGGSVADTATAIAAGGSVDVPVQSSGGQVEVSAGAVQQVNNSKGIDMPTAIAAAGAAYTFAKTGSLTQAATAYTMTSKAVGDFTEKINPGSANEVQAAPVLDASGAPTGQMAVQTAGGGVQTVTSAGVPTGHNVVPSVDGGGTVIHQEPGQIAYSVDQSGNVTGQAMARTANGSYTPATQLPNGTYQIAGGGSAVQTVDGGLVTVTKDGAGNTVIADAAGQPTGTVLTRTADGYQPTVKSTNGAMYGVDAQGMATGSVVVKGAGGENVAAVRAADGTIRMANADGSASGTVLVETSGGTFVESRTQGNAGAPSSVRLPSGQTASVVETVGGTDAAVVRAGDGSIRMVDEGGSAGGTVMAVTADGVYGKVTNGSMQSVSGADVQVVRLNDGSSVPVVQQGNGYRLAYSDGSPSDVVVSRQGNNWSVSNNSSSTSVATSTTQKIVYEGGGSFGGNGGGNPTNTPSTQVVTVPSTPLSPADLMTLRGAMQYSVPAHSRADFETMMLQLRSGGQIQFDPSQQWQSEIMQYLNIQTEGSGQTGTRNGGMPFSPVVTQFSEMTGGQTSGDDTGTGWGSEGGIYNGNGGEGR